MTAKVGYKKSKIQRYLLDHVPEGHKVTSKSVAIVTKTSPVSAADALKRLAESGHYILTGRKGYHGLYIYERCKNTTREKSRVTKSEVEKENEKLIKEYLQKGAELGKREIRNKTYEYIKKLEDEILDMEENLKTLRGELEVWYKIRDTLIK